MLQPKSCNSKLPRLLLVGKKFIISCAFGKSAECNRLIKETYEKLVGGGVFLGKEIK